MREPTEPRGLAGLPISIEPDGTFDEYETLAEAMELIVVGGRDLEDLLHEIASRFRRVLDFERCAVALVNDDRRTYRALTLVDPGAATPREEPSVPLEIGIAGRVFCSGQRRPFAETVRRGSSSAPHGDPAIGSGAPGSALVVPMLGSAEILGVVVLVSTRRRYDERDAKRAQALAVELALAIVRKDAEASLARSRGFFPTLLEPFPSPIWCSGKDALCDYFNREWLDFTGRTLQQELGEGWIENVHPDDVKPCVEGYLGAFHSHAPFVIEYRLRRWDGEFRWVLDQGRPYADLDARFGGYIGSCSDVTERKALQATVDRRVRDLVDGLDAIVWESDSARHRYTFVSRKIEAVLGYPLETWLKEGEFWLRHVHPDDRASASAAHRAALDGRGEPTFEYRALAADGHAVWLEDRVLPAGGGRGPVGARGVTVDTTLKRQIDRQLLHAQKMEALARISGGVAHEFNNILTFILGRCDFASSRLHDARAVNEDIDHIRRAADRAASVTRQLLAFSSDQTVVPRVIEVDSVVADLREVLRHVLGEQIELSLSLGAARGTVWADPVEIERILVNLAMNARDAMPGGGTLSIATANVEFDPGDSLRAPYERVGPSVRLSVRDTGTGMDARTCARIFEPYFTTKDLGSGVGLGLSTVFGIVKGAHGGIRVDSDVGRGTLFEIHWPRSSAPSGSIEAVAPAALEDSAARTILIVEDEDDIRDIAREFLELEGYRVLEAGDGVEALRVAVEHPGQIDLILTDVRMPRMGGYELAKEILASWPDIKLVFTSGYSSVPASEQVEAARARPFLQKPYTLDRLATTIRQLLGGGAG